jgi:hypothetical protein
MVKVSVSWTPVAVVVLEPRKLDRMSLLTIPLEVRTLLVDPDEVLVPSAG